MPVEKLSIVPDDAKKLAELRAEFDALAADIFEENTIRMPYLMTRATKV